MAIHNFQSPDFSLRQLQYAVAVADTGGFGTAASLCGVSQPSLSAQVAKLESVLEAELFLRSGKGVRLSPAGERLMPVFRQALNAAAGVEVAAASLRDPYAIPLRIAVIPTVAPYLLPAATRLLGRRAGPSVHWLELQTALAEEGLARCKADAIVIADPPSDASCHVTTLGWEPFVAALPPGESAPDEVSMEWFRAQQVLLLEEGHCLRDHAVSLCELPKEHQFPFQATSLSTLVQMLASGFGVSVLPAMAVEVEAGRADMQVRPFADKDIGRTLRLVYAEGHPMTPVLEELADLLREALDVALRRGA